MARSFWNSAYHRKITTTPSEKRCLFIREGRLSNDSLSRLARVGSHAHTRLQRKLGHELWHIQPRSWPLRVWPGRKKMQGGDGLYEAATVSATGAQSKGLPSLFVQLISSDL